MLPIAILSGGFATRLGSLTKEKPKCLIEVSGKPFVDWQIDLLVENGYTDFVFCVSHKSNLVQDHLGDGSQWGVRFRFSLDGEKQLGTGGAIQKALPFLGAEFAVIYGDSYLPINYREVELNFLNSRRLALMTVYKNKNNFDTSNVEFLDERLANYDKEKITEKMHHIDYGLTYFRQEAFTRYVNESQFDLSKLCNKLACNGLLDGYEVFERFYEVGSFEGLEAISHYLEKR